MEHPRSISRSQAIEFEVALLERAIHSGGRIRPVRARTKPQARSPDGTLRPRTELQGLSCAWGHVGVQFLHTISFTISLSIKESKRDIDVR